MGPRARQWLYVGYKIAAMLGKRYLKVLEDYQNSIAANAKENLYGRRLKPFF